MSQLEKADQLQKLENKVKRTEREGQDVWSKGVVVKRGGGGVEKCCCCFLEKSSGGFVLYLVPLGGFEEGRLALIFAWC